MILLCTLFLCAHVSSFLFARNGIYLYSYQNGIISFLCTEFRLFQCWYILFYIEITSHVSPYIFRGADHFWCEWTLYQRRILSIVRLNEQLWRSATSVYFVIRSTVVHLTSISESCDANEKLFTPVERAFCLERPCSTHHWSLPKNN